MLMLIRNITINSVKKERRGKINVLPHRDAFFDLPWVKCGINSLNDENDAYSHTYIQTSVTKLMKQT